MDLDGRSSCPSPVVTDTLEKITFLHWFVLDSGVIYGCFLYYETEIIFREEYSH